MRITGVKTIVVGNPWKNWLFVKLETDEGLTGLGEATGGLETTPIEAQVREISRFVVGENPLEPVRLWQRMYKGVFLNVSVAMNAIEIACWDILGKSLQTPLWKLLGGKQRPRLRAYANGWYQGPRDPSFFAEAAGRVKEMGYTALKFDPFGAAYRFLDREAEELAIHIIRAVREAVGDGVDILIEGHDRFSVSTAIHLARRMEEFHPMFFETPVMSTDIAATQQVARSVRVPVAAGERFRRLAEVAQLVADRSVSIVQPETLNIGGVSGAAKAAAIAEAAEAFVALHQAQSPLCTAVNAHIHASIPNFLIQECFDDFLAPWAREVCRGVPAVKDGYLDPSDSPGHGVELDEAEAARRPYGSANFLRLFEDGWELRK
ncbi:MAG: mandelate racemase/muconate lactonizing enzyme family protein [Bryobacteraceae bacterium]|nr:mandelate racemase/muconate lactonizing enzyme family protein [Bryobacteraceae bacterium]